MKTLASTCFVIFLVISSPALSQTVTVQQSFDFGEFVVVPGGGSVTVFPIAGSSYSNTTATPTSSSPQPAQFRVDGTADTTFDITYPGTPVNLTGGSSGALTLDNFTDNSPGITNGLGIATISVGARLNVDIGDIGTFTGNFNVTVNYN